VALRCVWQVRQAVKVPIMGMGGIASAEDVLEFLLVGATAVQVGTANFTRPDFSFRLVEDLPILMQKWGIDSLDEYRGSLKL
jgi:dihydroorotate dehydrogenase (NAD+) catalytic subunit